MREYIELRVLRTAEYIVEKRATVAGRLPWDWMHAQKPYVRIPLYYILLLALIFFGVLGSSSFIYFQF